MKRHDCMSAHHCRWWERWHVQASSFHRFISLWLKVVSRSISYATPHIGQSHNWSHYTVFRCLIDLIESWSCYRVREKQQIFAFACSANLENNGAINSYVSWEREKDNYRQPSVLNVVAAVARCTFHMHSHRIRLAFLSSGPISMPHP